MLRQKMLREEGYERNGTVSGRQRTPLKEAGGYPRRDDLYD